MISSEAIKPVLDDATRGFVKRSLAAGLVELDDLKKVVVSLMADSPHFTPERLANGLMNAGILTKWQAGKLLVGRSKGFYLGSYRLLRPIGKGGMGMVYLGEHQVMKRQMALKILPPEATDNARRLDRFKEEARACAQLDHPNIVRAYDFAQAGGRHYIVMEYIDGIDLQHLVQRDGVMSTAEALDVLNQACEGLAHAHERGIIHRDIKPANLLLRTDGVLKVSDLGLARIGLSELDHQDNHRLMGTADFVAPEQAINSQNIDARADIYSLGCTLFYLLTGRPPFVADSVRQRLAKHQTAEVPDLRVYRDDCPAGLADLFNRMMAKRPSDRPKSATELLVQLRRMGAGTNEKPAMSIRHVQPASDTSIDERIYQATLEDSSLSADGEINLGQGIEEFDFGDLPALPVASTSGSGVLGISGSGGNRSTDAIATFKSAPVQASSGAKGAVMTTSGRASDSNQLVLLGVGLAFAVLALVAVIGIGIHSFTQPLPLRQPKIKATEDGKSVVVINQSS
ncbi:serine/threonine protein kinase [Rubripirellula amarantea]|nr:serine/threonine protein kinase [Rubripirellula amarantea]